ncbi:MAG: hypothetical protein CMH52_10520 [Myxococcales bacterium]|nr:hypothetical protein [Myxococcales bacterium]
MLRFSKIVCAIWLAGTLGCGQESTSSSNGDDSRETDRGIVSRLDGSLEPDLSMIGDASSSDADQTDGGVSGDGAVPLDSAQPTRDMFIPVDITSCETACARYDDCGRTADVFGSSEACLSQCERLTRDGEAPVQNWWSCAGSESCNLLHLCPVPEVERLECAEVCQLIEGCDIGLDIADCETVCETGGDAFQGCAENLYGADCGNDAFLSCLGRDVYNNCSRFCGPAVACNVVRAGECERDCIQGYLNADPLSDANQARMTQCVVSSDMDCGDIDDCLQPFSFDPPPLVPQEDFCRVYDQCELGFLDGACEDEYQNLLIQAGNSGIECAYNSMRAQCPDFFFEVTQICENAASTQITTACNRFCGAQNLCGQIDGGVPACNEQCLAGFGDDPDANERVSSEIGCIRETTCPEFSQCVELASPAGQCQRFCDARAACGEIEEDCVAACDQTWPRDRYQNLRECVANAADDCDAVNACELAPTIPCDSGCARLQECGVASPRCLAACDDLHVQEPIAASLQIGCILAADVCQPEEGVLSVDDCLRDPEAAGRACLNFCRSETDCNPAADLSTCLTRCVSGFGDVNGLRFAQAEACLDMAASDAACAVIDACIPAEPIVDCLGYCQQIDACQADRANCFEQCEAEPPLDRMGCVSDAIRTGQQCGGVATCEGVEPPAASADCNEYCNYQKSCDRAFDTYLCQLACTPDPAYLNVRNACLGAARCDQAPCLELDGAVSADCENACLTAVACGAFPDAQSCGETCTGLVASPNSPDDLMDRINACLAEVRTPMGCDADAAAQCFQPAYCEAVPDVIFAPRGGGRINYDTTGQPSAGRLSCGGGGGQQVVVITIDRQSNASFSVVNPSYDPLIELRGECDDAASAIECNDDSNGIASRIPRGDGTIVLEAGIYYLYIDGFLGRTGTGTIDIQIQPLN